MGSVQHKHADSVIKLWFCCPAVEGFSIWWGERVFFTWNNLYTLDITSGANVEIWKFQNGLFEVGMFLQNRSHIWAVKLRHNVSLQEYNRRDTTKFLSQWHNFIANPGRRLHYIPPWSVIWWGGWIVSKMTILAKISFAWYNCQF